VSEPTQESLDEAARAAGFDNWQKCHDTNPNHAFASTLAHAHTLDQLHDRKPPVDPMAELLAEIAKVWATKPYFDSIRQGRLDDFDRAAIEVLRAAFAERDAKIAALQAMGEPVEDQEVRAVLSNICAGSCHVPNALRFAGLQITRAKK
jgi:hypothetical protein